VRSSAALLQQYWTLLRFGAFLASAAHDCTALNVITIEVLTFEAAQPFTATKLTTHKLAIHKLATHKLPKLATHKLATHKLATHKLAKITSTNHRQARLSRNSHVSLKNHSEDVSHGHRQSQE
jgi:hypothetical protein